MTDKVELHDLVDEFDKDVLGDVGTVELSAIGTAIRYSQRSAAISRRSTF